jgi:hypothetical protein
LATKSREKSKPKPAEKVPIKKVPLTTGIVFLAIGIVNLVLAIFSSDASSKAAYAALVATFVTLGMTQLDKSGILER